MEQKEDLRSWAEKERLPEKVIQVLQEQGFTCADEVKDFLSPDDIKSCFQDSGLLNMAQCLALKKAVSKPSVTPDFSASSVRSLPQPSQSDALSSISAYNPSPQTVPFPRPSNPRESSIPQQSHASTTLYNPTAGGASGFGSSGAMNMDGITSAFRAVDIQEEEVFRLLLVGKCGSGKSTTGNTILGKKLFHTGLKFSAVTSGCERKLTCQKGRKFEIMDCPGLYDTQKSNEEISIEIVQAVAGMHPGPHAVLYVIDITRYTDEEFGTYLRLKGLFDETITNHMIVLFTGGDKLERNKTTIEQLIRQKLPKGLQQVLKECNNRYIVFNNMAKDAQPQVDCLLSMVKGMLVQNDYQVYACPKYSDIGQGMEEEVARRLEKIEKEDVQRMEYVKQLKSRAQGAEERAKETTEQSEKNEQERKRKMEQEEQKYRRLKDELSAQWKKDQDHTQKQEEELKRLLREREDQARKMKEKEHEMTERDRQRAAEDMERMRQREKEMQDWLIQERERMARKQEEDDERRRKAEKEMQDFKDKLEEQRLKEKEEIQKANEQKEKLYEQLLAQAKKDAEEKEARHNLEIERIKAEMTEGEQNKMLSIVGKGLITAVCAGVGAWVGGPAGATAGLTLSHGITDAAFS